MTWIKAPDNWVKVNPAFIEDAPFDEPVEFNDNGTASVKEEVADFLVEAYSEIEYYDNEEN